MPKESRSRAVELPVGKFVAPQPAASCHLRRPRLLDRLRHFLPGRRVLLVEGQPGQGKSVLVAQLLAEAQLPALWYRLDAGDAAPGRLLAGVLVQLPKVYPQLQLESLRPQLPPPDCSPAAAADFANRLLTTAAAQLGGQPGLLIFDGLEELAAEAPGLQLLGELARNSLPELKTVLIGRQLPVQLRQSLEPDGLLEISNDELALTPSEIHQLFDGVLQLPYPRRYADTLYRLTHGWTAGVVHFIDALRTMSAHPVSGPIEQWSPVRLARQRVDDFFRHRVLSRLTAEQRQLLVQLAWLERLTPPLVGGVLSWRNPQLTLQELAAANLFLAPHPQQRDRFAFQPLFREFLRQHSAVELGPDGHQPLLTAAADWALAHGRNHEAARYLLRARRFERAERLLRERPSLLLRPSRLLQIPGGTPLPEPCDATATPWLGLAYALALLEGNPFRALPLLERVQQAFAEQGQREGELVALSQRILAHCLSDCCVNTVSRLQSRLRLLLEQQTEPLPQELDLLTTLGCACGHLHLHGDATLAQAYADRALALAQKLDSINHEVVLRLVRGFTYLFLGVFPKVAIELEHLHRCLRELQVSPLNRAFVGALSCNYLLYQGFDAGFQRHAGRLEREDQDDLLQNSQIGPLLGRWRAELALGADDFHGVLEHAEAGLAQGYAAASPHLRSLLLQYRAYAYAARGVTAKARADSAESSRLRHIAGGSHFLLICRILQGATYTLLEDYALADEVLTEAVTLGRQIDTPYALAGAYAHRAWLRLRQGEAEAARGDCARFLALMREHEFRRCFAWSPGVILPVLELAVREGIEETVAQQLAERRLQVYLDPEEGARPLLQLRTLGTLEIWLRGRRLASSRDLTPRPQQYLATLAAAPGLELPRETLQEAIWPDGGQSTSKLYALRNRIKNVIGTDQVDLERYFVLRGSLVRLEHVQVDAFRFAYHVRNGIRHWRNNQRWQAGNAFYKAHLLWHGGFAPTAPETDPVRDFRAELERLNNQRVMLWSEILSASGDTEEAAEVLADHFSADPTDNEVAARLYQLHLLRGRPATAERVLRQHQDALEQEGFPAEQIDCVLDQIQAGQA